METSVADGLNEESLNLWESAQNMVVENKTGIKILVTLKQTFCLSEILSCLSLFN